MIKWDNAPKEATHAKYTGSGNVQWFMLSSEGNWYHLYDVKRGVGRPWDDATDWSRVYGTPSGEDMFHERPNVPNPHDAWDGESFPPAGLTVEAMFTTDETPEWFEFTFHAKGVFRYFGTVRMISTDMSYDDSWNIASMTSMKFQRLRTPEQRAAEKLQSRVDEFSLELHSHDPSVEINDAAIVALIELGYIDE